MKKKIVLIGDIVSSKAIINRAKIQEKLADTLNSLNKENINLISPYTITIGDEFQAVFRNANKIFYDVMKILLTVYPEKIRFSIGIGTIDTQINKKQAIGMDGPAFHKAREGIEELKESQYLYTIVGLHTPYKELIKHTLNIVSHISRKWRRSRLQVLLMLYKEIPIKEIAKRLNLSDKSIYKTIEAGELKTIIQLFEETSKIINQCIEEK